MSPTILYITCGLLAGIVGGYVGIGGGIIMVPFLTVVMGVDIKTAAPVSLLTIVVSSLASSNEYIKRDMIDLGLVVSLGLYMTLGNIAGSLLSELLPGDVIRVTLACIVVYAAVTMLKGRNDSSSPRPAERSRQFHLLLGTVSLLSGVVSSVVGIGGGLMMVPIMYLVLGVPLTIARGTSLLLIGFSSAAAAAIYLANGRIDFAIAAPVILGIIIGGRIGGKLGAVARPLSVRIAFAALLIYMSWRLIYEPLKKIV